MPDLTEAGTVPDCCTACARSPRQRAAYIRLAQQTPCPCGKPVPAGRVAYCSDACRLADKDHGPDEVGGDES